MLISLALYIFCIVFPIPILGGTALAQGLPGVHSAGHVELDDKTVCGDTWDVAAAQVVCRELGWGPPIETAGYATNFLGT